MEFHQTCLQVNLDAIKENYIRICQKAGTDVLAVVKADAYGLGAIAVAKSLESLCPMFGVANLSEALELHHAGIQKPILILGRIPQVAYATAVQKGFRHPIFRMEDAIALSEEAVRQGRTAIIHLAVDTGMGRIGLPATEEGARLCLAISRLPGLQVEGLFTHYAKADCRDLSNALSQSHAFSRFDEMLRREGLEIPIRHLSNSAGIMNFSTHYEMVRAGIILYGICPSSEVDPQLLPVKSVVRLQTRIAYIKTLPAGCPISYGGIYITDRTTRVATLPIGYADGYRRSLTEKAHVLIRGQKAPIIGRICMDQLMVDVTHIPEAEIDDVVTVIGTDGAETITPDDLADRIGTISYEILCGFSRRIPRVYIQNRKPVSEVNYLLAQEDNA